jgi:hypothetical protein
MRSMTEHEGLYRFGSPRNTLCHVFFEDDIDVSLRLQERILG